MKRFALIMALPLILTACSSSDNSNEKKEPSYEEKATKAITDFTQAKYVEKVKLLEEVSAEAVNSDIEKLNEALEGFETGLKMYELAKESYEAAKESMSNIDVKTFGAYLGMSDSPKNYDSLIQEVIVDIDELKIQIEEVTSLIEKYRQATDNAGGKSPFTVFQASVDAELRTFAVSPKGSKEIKVLFETNK